MVNSILGHFDLSQLAPFHKSIQSLLNSHLYCTQVNSILSIFRTFFVYSLQNEIIFAKRGVAASERTRHFTSILTLDLSLYVYFNVGSFGFCYKFLATLNQASLINLINIYIFFFFFATNFSRLLIKLA